MSFIQFKKNKSVKQQFVYKIVIVSLIYIYIYIYIYMCIYVYILKAKYDRDPFGLLRGRTRVSY